MTAARQGARSEPRQVGNWLRCVAAVAVAAGVAFSSISAQVAFVDDAGRRVQVPARINRVFAAGAPAEVLLYTLAPDKLPGRNRLPDSDGLQFFPEAYRTPRLVRQLPEIDNPAADADLLSIAPDLYVDYGSVLPDYVAALEAVSRRTSIPGIILDGRLERVPDVYRRLGALLGLDTRGRRLAESAATLLARYRDILRSGNAGVRVYLTCSPDGTVPCLADDPTGEQLAHLGAVNVAGTRQTAPGRPLTVADIAALRPDAVVVTGFAGAAARLRADSAWQAVPAVANGRVYQLPGQPYSWGARPPSVNRLIGVAWLAYVLQGRPFDATLRAEVRSFYGEFYHLDLTNAQLELLLQR